MIKSIKYICQKCDASFNNQLQCIDHEKVCHSIIPIKLIAIPMGVLSTNQKLEFTVIEYKDSYLHDQFIVCDKSTDRYCNINDLNKILDDSNNFQQVIYTAYFGAEQQKFYKKLLLDKRKKFLETFLSEINKQINDVQELKKLL